MPLMILAQESEWSFHLANQYSSKSTKTRVISYFVGMYDGKYIDTRTNGFHLMQPSFRKTESRKFIEFGLRNTTLTSNSSADVDYAYYGIAPIKSFEYSFFTSTIYYSRNYKLFGQKNGFFLGAEAFLNPNYTKSILHEQFFNTDHYSLKRSSIIIGFSAIPRYQLKIRNKFILDFSTIVNFVHLDFYKKNSSYQFHHYPYPHGGVSYNRELLFPFQITPQLSFGLKI